MNSRVSGEMFIGPESRRNYYHGGERCNPSAMGALDGKSVWFYKHFVPTARLLPIKPPRRYRKADANNFILLFAILLIANVSVFTITAKAQRTNSAATPSSIPSPRSVLGFNPGDDRTIADWKQITDYFARLDRASDRVQVQTIGQSTLGRTMIAAFISAPENIRSLEKYKEIQRRLADPRLNPADGRGDFRDNS